MVDLSKFHRELAIPSTRLHDCHWPNPDVVDIHVVFPNFDADPNLPESYDFSRTDDYIQAIINVGSQIVYRLGESIEHTRKKYFVHPPKDYLKWAAICVGIIRHYNEGWANGFRHNIQYWEIWNEPENRPAMWSGSDDDYLRLYETTAKAIKSRFPTLRVGGPALGSTGELVGDTLRPTPFLLNFLDRCRRRAVPLDFFSWHRYAADPEELTMRAHAVRRLLDAKGFRATESHLNEWNYLPDENWHPILLAGQGIEREKCYAKIGGAPGAAFVACALSSFQDCPIDVANYYTGEIQGFGLFTFDGVPKKTFYAIKAFRALLDTPIRFAITNASAGLTLCAGRNVAGTEAAVLISNFNSAEKKARFSIKNLPWSGPTLFDTKIVNAEKNLEAGPSGQLRDDLVELQIPAPSVLLLRLHQ